MGSDINRQSCAMSFREIADSMGITRVRAGQIYRSAIIKLKAERRRVHAQRLLEAVEREKALCGFAMGPWHDMEAKILLPDED